tara:strand:- start:659 stop:856 length:198 start_codon:yes stop_codon:yes gene_type:complete
MKTTVGTIYSALQRARAEQKGGKENEEGAAIAEVHLERVLQDCKLTVTLSAGDATVCGTFLSVSS